MEDLLSGVKKTEVIIFLFSTFEYFSIHRKIIINISLLKIYNIHDLIYKLHKYIFCNSN